jgi:hypothetical protein
VALSLSISGESEGNGVTRRGGTEVSTYHDPSNSLAFVPHFAYSILHRSGTPMVLGLRKDAMEAVRRAFPGQKFAIDVVSRAFGRPDPTERSQQDSSACGISGTRTPENSADLEQAEHAVQGCDAPPAPVDLGGEAGGGCKRRYGLVDLQPTAHSMMFTESIVRYFDATGCGTRSISVFSRPVCVS